MGLGPIFVASFLLLFCCATGSNRIHDYTCTVVSRQNYCCECMYIERNNQQITLSNQPTNQPAIPIVISLFFVALLVQPCSRLHLDVYRQIYRNYSWCIA